MGKSAEAFRTISEASDELGVPQHVLRHWEDVFGHIRPMRRAGGRRYYRPIDLDLLRGVKALLYKERYTTKGVQKIFRENGAKYIIDLGQRDAAGEEVDSRADMASVDDSAKADQQNVNPNKALPQEGAGQPGTEIGSQVISGETVHYLQQLLKDLETVQHSLHTSLEALEQLSEEAGVEKTRSRPDNTSNPLGNDDKISR